MQRSEHDAADNQTYKNKFNYDRFGNQYRNSAEQTGPTGGNVLPAQITESTNSTGDNGDIDKNTNRLTTATGTIYDEAGNITKDVKFRNFDYVYDANNRLVQAQSNVSGVTPVEATSVYDALGQRVATQIGNAWRVFVYDIAGQMIAEYAATLSQETNSIQYLFTDRQGSTRTITSAAGTVLGRMDYTAFGEEIGANVGGRATTPGYSTTSEVRNRYALTERDEATGLDHTWWRKNESKAGRWTSPDPYKGSMSLSNPQSFNRYSYTNNDPVNFVDPSGLNSASSGTSYSWSCWGTWRSEADGSNFQITSMFCQTWSNGSANGGGQVGNNTGPKVNKFNREQFDKCINKLFGGRIKDLKFDFKRETGGKFSYTDSVNAKLAAERGSSSTMGTFSGVTDVTTNSAASLAGMYNRENPGRQRYLDQSGYTSSNNTQRNWIARDVASNYNDYPADNGFLGLFIHEMGNQIANQLGLNNWDTKFASEMAKLGIKDGDYGAALESCSFGNKGIVGLRTGRLGPSREL